jgi:hypothetical protein
MQKYHMEILLWAAQERKDAKARTAKRQLENAYDLAPEFTKRQPTAVTKDQQSYANGLIA